MTAQPETLREFRVFMRSGKAIDVLASGQSSALDRAEQQAVGRGWIGRDAIAAKAERVR